MLPPSSAVHSISLLFPEPLPAASLSGEPLRSRIAISAVSSPSSSLLNTGTFFSFLLTTSVSSCSLCRQRVGVSRGPCPEPIPKPLRSLLPPPAAYHRVPPDLPARALPAHLYDGRSLPSLPSSMVDRDTYVPMLPARLAAGSTSFLISVSN